MGRFSSMKNHLVFIIILTLSFSACQHKNDELKGKSIVVSAPSIYAQRLKTALEKHQAKVVLMPAIKTTIHDSLPELKALYESTNSRSQMFDYIILPSRNAIKAFDRAIKHDKSYTSWKSGPYYTIGKDRELLQQLGYKSEIKLVEPSLKGIIETIKLQRNYKGKDLLLIAPKVINMPIPSIVPNFIKEIEQLGITCHIIAGYTTSAIINKENEKVIEGLKKGKYDMLAITSGGECIAINSHTPPFSIECDIACFGPYTAQSARNAGFKVDLISEKFGSFDDFATSIVKYYE